MIDSERGITPQTIEDRLMPERKILTRVRDAAEQLRDLTVNTFNNSKDASFNSLQKAWYTHTTSLFLLESVAAKTLSSVDPNFATAWKGLAGTLFSAALASQLEQVLRGRISQFPVGEHMDIQVLRFKWPKEKQLSDGTTIKPGSKIGVIHFDRNLPTADEKESERGFSRKLYESGKNSLEELAFLCEANDPRLAGIEGFYGLSHIAGPLAKRLGFDIFETSDPLKLIFAQVLGKRLVGKVVNNNPNWQKLAKNYKSPKEAFISRQKLVALFGSTSKAPQNNKIPV